MPCGMLAEEDSSRCSTVTSAAAVGRLRGSLAQHACASDLRKAAKQSLRHVTTYSCIVKGTSVHVAHTHLAIQVQPITGARPNSPEGAGCVGREGRPQPALHHVVGQLVGRHAVVHGAASVHLVHQDAEAAGRAGRRQSGADSARRWSSSI